MTGRHRVVQWLSATATVVATALLASCGEGGKSAAPALDGAACLDTALLHDYQSIRTVTFDPTTNRLRVGDATRTGVVAQAAIDCQRKVRLIATNSNRGGPLKPRIDVLEVDGKLLLRRLPVKEGINGFLVDGNRVLVATAAGRRAPIDPSLGALSSSEQPSMAPGEHLHTELIGFEINTGAEVSRLRYPAPTQEWLVGPSVVTLGASILRIDLATGHRTRLFDFTDAPDFPRSSSAFHRASDQLFAVTGGRHSGSSRYPGGAIFRLEPMPTPGWRRVTQAPLTDPVFSFDDGHRIYVFPRQAQSVHVFDSRTAALRSVETPIAPGLEVRAAARLASGILVLGMRPVADSPGVFDGVGHAYLFSEDFLRMLAEVRFSGIGNAPELSSSMRKTPSGASQGYLGR